MKQLIKMSDYVLDKQRFKEDSDIAIFNVTNYANILNQPLELGMFVPCDDDGNVLEEPRLADVMNKQGYFNYAKMEHLEKQYQQAKAKVLFEGFEVIENNSDKTEYSKSIAINNFLHVFWFDSQSKEWRLSFGLNTIEDLTHYNLKLTDNQF